MARKNQLLNQRLNRDNGRPANETPVVKREDVPETQNQSTSNNKRENLTEKRFKRQSEGIPNETDINQKSASKIPYYNRKKLVQNHKEKTKKDSGLLGRIPSSQGMDNLQNTQESNNIRHVQEQDMKKSQQGFVIESTSNDSMQETTMRKKRKEKPSKVPKMKAIKEKSSKKRKNEDLSRISEREPNTEEKTKRVQQMYENPSLEQINKMPEPINAEEYELHLEKASLEQAQKKIKREKRAAIVSQIGKVFMMLLSFYLVFLIYGVVMTNYEYDNTGKIVPCVMTVEEIKEQREYDLILSCYEDARDIYGEIFMLDYRVSLNEEDYRVIATEYELITDRLTPLINKMNAMEFSSKYTVVYNMLLNWTSEYVAGYVQNMAIALSTDNQEAASKALAYREYMISNFTAIQENMVSIGNTITGVYTEEISEWSPEAYIREQIYGKE